ncbi:MAG: hypothetical protein ACRCZE_02355, partial [Candidatus Altimarinota bacterium]
MIISFKKVSKSEDRKDNAKKLQESILASRKVFDSVLTPEFAKTFGVDLTQQVAGHSLKSIIFRDIAQQPRARGIPLQEIFLKDGFQKDFVDPDSLLLIMAVSWYDLVQKFHQGKYKGTKHEHRQLIMVIYTALSNHLAEVAEKVEKQVGLGGAEEEREALRRYRLAAGQAFNSIPKMEQELGLREAPPKSRRRIKNDAATDSNSVDFSQTAGWPTAETSQQPAPPGVPQGHRRSLHHAQIYQQIKKAPSFRQGFSSIYSFLS